MYKFDKIFDFYDNQNTEHSIILTSPHSGRSYPSEFLRNVSSRIEEIRIYEDFMVDKLYDFAPAIGCKLLINNIPRIIIDLNRNRNEIDNDMFYNFSSTNFEITKKVKTGIGLFPRYIGLNNIYNRKLNWLTYKSLINTVYNVWHDKLNEEIYKIKNSFSNAVLLDCHSMPSFDLNGKKISDIPDFVIGDLFHKSCKKEIVDFVVNALKKEGFSVAVNKPYAGAYILKKYGKPEKKINAMQIEIRKDLYCNEKELTLNKNYSKVKSILKGLIVNLSNEIKYNTPEQKVAE
tara:strand:+ start:251 stop:1120 length:870 start_codon:yes stop_codon:yes gene_type:complete